MNIHNICYLKPTPYPEEDSVEDFNESVALAKKESSSESYKRFWDHQDYRHLYPAMSALSEEARAGLRRDYLSFWQATHRRHVEARTSWREKLNHYLNP